MSIETIEPLLSALWDSRNLRVLSLELYTAPSGLMRLDVSVTGPTYAVPVEPLPDQAQRCARCGAMGPHSCNRSDLLTKSVFLTPDESGARIDDAHGIAIKMALGADTPADHAALDTVPGDAGPFTRIWSRP